MSDEVSRARDEAESVAEGARERARRVSEVVPSGTALESAAGDGLAHAEQAASSAVQGAMAPGAGAASAAQDVLQSAPAAGVPAALPGATQAAAAALQGAAPGAVASATSAAASAVARAVPAQARGVAAPLARAAQGVVSAALGAAGLGAGGSAGAEGPDGDVAYELESDAYAGHLFEVHAVTLVEALNEPYRLRVEVGTPDRDTDAAQLLGSNCTLAILRGEHVQHVRGIALRVEEAPVDDRAAGFTLVIGPALALLAYRRDSRIFQEKTVPEILAEVLEEALGPYEREVRAELTETYEKREHCLQFDETDLDFVHRLLEEEGIGYAFDHADEREVLFLFDANATCPEVLTMDGADVPFWPHHQEVRTAEPVTALTPAHALGATSVLLRDLDWTQQGDMRVEAEDRGEDAQGKDRELYEHHRRVLTITDYDAGVEKYQKHDAPRQARVRAELARSPAATARGLSRVTGFRAGLRFALAGHPNPGADREYLLVRVEHHKAELPDGSASRDRVAYHNRFEAVPADVPWRPARATRKPRIHGVQTAVVVGPSGEEIHTDEHGRIKVQMHWDRLGMMDEHSSCWMRVQQPWAGPGWGFVFIPRIGMEVLVTFLDGDPDRPMVIGSVYDGNNRPPYPLPDEKTKSTIKTNSSPGGDGYNELRFEDRAGSEQIFVHAQKDYDEVVEHDHTTTVHNDQTNHVDQNQTQSIGANQTESVGGQQTMTVDKNRTVHIKGSQSVTIDGGEANAGISGSKLNITGDYQVDASDWIEMQAPTRIKLTCGGSSILIEPGKITLTASGKAQIVLDANALMKSAKDSKVFLDTNALTQSSQGSKVLLDPNALVEATGHAKVLFDDKANMTSAGGSQVLLDGNALVHGAANAKLEAPTEAVVASATAVLSGSGQAHVTGGTTTVAGGTTNVTGSGTVNISGALVAIN